MNKNMITDRTVLDGLVYTKWLRQGGKIREETMEMAYGVFNKLIP